MIKKFLIFGSLVFCMLSASYGQQDEEPLYTRAGFKFGLNYSNITGDTEDTDARVRMHLGAVIEFPITQRIYIQPELLYSAQGYKIEEERGENKISLNYLSLPIITKLFFTPRFGLETGPQFSNLANVSESFDNSPDEFFDSFSDFDFSWVFGIEYKAESGVFIQARYNLGLSNLSEIDMITDNNTVIQISAGYLFKTKNNRRIDNQFEE